MGINNIRYPHILSVDVPVLTRFLTNHEHEFLRLEFDVHVGRGAEPLPDLPPNIREMSIKLTQKRIDIVGTKLDEKWIIEVTRSAGIKAVGQLVSYPILYKQTFPTERPVIPLLIAEKLESDIEPILEAQNIPFLLFPEEV